MPLNRQLVVGAPGQILGYHYDGQNFTNTANSSLAGTAASWMIFKQPNQLYAVDENSNSTRLFEFNTTNSCLSAEPVHAANGSSGVVSLEFNKNQTRLVGTSYSQGQVDVWDISSPDGSLQLVKQIPLQGPVGPTAIQGIHRAHQAVLDPTGQFFAIPDLSGDAIHILDSSKWEIASRVAVEPAGAGPRHGAFIGGNSTTLPNYFVVACEIANIVILYNVEQSCDGTIKLTHSQTLSSYGAQYPPKNATTAAAGELIAAHNGRDIYVSNRLTGNETDHIAHFLLQDGNLVFNDQISSGGINPRQLSFSTEEAFIFGANLMGEKGLVAFKRSFETGILTPAGSLPNAEINTMDGYGPQFVMEIPLTR